MNRAQRGVFDTVSTISIMPNEMADLGGRSDATAPQPRQRLHEVDRRGGEPPGTARPWQASTAMRRRASELGRDVPRGRRPAASSADGRTSASPPDSCAAPDRWPRGE